MVSFFIKCSCCDHINHYNEEFTASDFEIVESYEKDMGPDNTYSCCLGLECNKCKSYMEAIVNINEYPVGIFNDRGIISVDGGEKLSDPCLNDCIEQLKVKSLCNW